MYVRPQLPILRDKFGQPYHLWMAQEFDERGWRMVQQSQARRRVHDVTLVISEGRERFALLARHSHPPGFFSNSSLATPTLGDFSANAEAEIRAETGLTVKLEKFLLQVTLDIRHGDDLTAWDTYVFKAACMDPPAKIVQTKELLWVSPTQMEGLGEKLLATDQGGLLYRGRLTNAIRWAMQHDLRVRETDARDHLLIEGNLKRAHLEAPDFERTHWWIADIEGVFAGTVGLTPHADCLELSGLAVDPAFRGRGVGNALVEHALSRALLPDKKRLLVEKFRRPLADPIWLITDLPGYFLPTGFTMVGDHDVPVSLKPKMVNLKAAMKFPRPTAV